MFDTVGVATAIGEQPIKGLIDSACGAGMTVGEALTNLVFAQISDIKDIKCSGNWMWAAKLPGEGAKLYDACEAMCSTLSKLGIAIDGGKDSLSMAARVGSDVVKAPGALVLSVYVPCPDVRKTVTPDLKLNDEESLLLHVKFSKHSHRLGGSAFAQVFGQIGNESPDMDDIELFNNGFLATQQLIKEGKIQSGHDISDGGLITCILEMAFSGNCGVKVDLQTTAEGKHAEAIEVLFAEELGIVIEVAKSDQTFVMDTFSKHGVRADIIGRTNAVGSDALVSISVDGNLVLEDKMVVLRDIWEATSFQLERLQANKSCVEAEEACLSSRKAPPYKLSFVPKGPLNFDRPQLSRKRPMVAVIREEGSNGDREMASSLYLAGFDAWDVTMHDLCTGGIRLKDFRGVVFVGGFSYADVLGSAKGWAAVTRFNANAHKELEEFRAREDTFSLGVCNGCQLMGLIGWVAGEDNGNGLEQGVCFSHNDSGRFECRFATVKIESSPAIMLKDMAGSTLGIWIAHGEGKAEFKTDAIKQRMLGGGLAPIRFTDDEGCITTNYPFNPNGSPDGVAALCSPDGRHLAMMPHPERCSIMWQWPWMPKGWHTLKASPWLQMFHNAYDWCIETEN
eukprot:Seg8547.1 transcript_id=Seg8547.1/GoldUCD/mRNA.D3Y31 product="putative phosphoribosylformylglycinamidine synthase/mitochondrial" protein_id=Seg8547.1/GoldUCD/D3Y31